MKKLMFVIILASLSICSYAQWQINGSNIYYNEGSVGIGTFNPETKLEIIGDNNDFEGNIQNAVLTIKNNNYSRYRAISFSNTDFRNAQIQGIRGRGTLENPQDLVPGDRVFGVYGHIIQDGVINFSPIASMEYYVGNVIGSGEITFMTLDPTYQHRKERLRINAYGNVGIGTNEPLAKLHVADGDIYISDINRGLIMKSPDGNCWKGTLNNQGVLNFVMIDCLELTGYDHSPESESSIISIYPNPSDEYIQVKKYDNSDISLEYSIYDENSKLVINGTLDTQHEKINTGHLASGMYFIKVYNYKEGLSEIKKIVIK